VWCAPSHHSYSCPPPQTNTLVALLLRCSGGQAPHTTNDVSTFSFCMAQWIWTSQSPAPTPFFLCEQLLSTPPPGFTPAQQLLVCMYSAPYMYPAPCMYSAPYMYPAPCMPAAVTSHRSPLSTHMPPPGCTPAQQLPAAAAERGTCMPAQVTLYTGLHFQHLVMAQRLRAVAVTPPSPPPQTPHVNTRPPTWMYSSTAAARRCCRAGNLPRSRGAAASAIFNNSACTNSWKGGGYAVRAAHGCRGEMKAANSTSVHHQLQEPISRGGGEGGRRHRTT
jgi:hypothetical protein